jgi:glucose/mannose-6-phosphate isomerase
MRGANLDDVAALRRVDPNDMGRRISELPRQCREAIDLARAYPLPEEYARADSVVILGMGGSAIAGDLVRTLVGYESPVPIVINRDYQLPGFVYDRTLIIASSYSGDTEEVIAAFRAALDRDAMCVAVTTGGELAQICEEEGLPLIIFAYESQPRAALGYSLAVLLALLEQLGFVADAVAQLEGAVRALEPSAARIGVEVPEAKNLAKQLARRLDGKLPVIYGAEHLSQVARRWKCQLNENSKGWAFWEELPELNHNAVAGYEFPARLAAEVHVVLLASELYQPRQRARMEVTGEVLSQKGISHEYIHVVGESITAQMLWAIHLGDYVSYYLAALRDVDPTPVAGITYLKDRLAKIP